MNHKVKQHNGRVVRNTLPGGQRYQSVVGTKQASAVAERGPHPYWEVHVDAGEVIAVAAVVAAKAVPWLFGPVAALIYVVGRGFFGHTPDLFGGVLAAACVLALPCDIWLRNHRTRRAEMTTFTGAGVS